MKKLFKASLPANGNETSSHRHKAVTSALGLLALLLVMGAAQAQVPVWNGFPTPSKEELAMTSIPGQPGAPAVVLWREEIDNDNMHMKSFYERVKVLTAAGKDRAEVQIPFVNINQGYDGAGFTTNFDVEGRTVHADGTIIPFKGKPYIKTVLKTNDLQYRAIVFEMPDVEVGSIIEYHYVARYPDMSFIAPSWFVQGDLYVMAAHYEWYPTTAPLVGPDGGAINSISWFPILPRGAQVVRHDLTRGSEMTSMDQANQFFELKIENVPPAPEERMMPPITSFSYRVMFNFSEYRSAAEYWKQAGKQWSKNVNSFIDVNGKLSAATSAITAGASTPDEKLAKIYAAVEGIENTDFTRSHDRNEDKTAGLRQVKHASDVLENKRGSSWQITELFIAMARAAGLKAYAMLVPDRASDMFVPQWWNIMQFDDTIAVVNLDGKDIFFDPGERYCPFGHLVWQHTFVQGLRQTDDGTAFAVTTGDPLTVNRTIRIANLTMDEHGIVSGTINLQYTGAEALRWRQRALRGDEESVRGGLRRQMEAMLPGSLDVKVDSIEGLDQYEQPLQITFAVHGAIATASGRNIIIPSQLFASGEAATFPEATRDLPVYFPYPKRVQDAVRITFPTSISVEAMPDPAKEWFQKRAAYASTMEKTPTTITMRRDFELGDFLVLTKDYSDLRTFYGQMEGADHEPIVLQMSAAAAAANAPAAASSAVATPANGGGSQGID